MDQESQYMVKIVNLFSTIIEVTAKNEDEAREKAKEKYSLNPNENRNAFYESTLPPEHWAVITKEGYDKIKKEIEAELIKDNNRNDSSLNNKIIT